MNSQDVCLIRPIQIDEETSYEMLYIEIPYWILHIVSLHEKGNQWMIRKSWFRSTIYDLMMSGY